MSNKTVEKAKLLAHYRRIIERVELVGNQMKWCDLTNFTPVVRVTFRDMLKTMGEMLKVGHENAEYGTGLILLTINEGRKQLFVDVDGKVYVPNFPTEVDFDFLFENGVTPTILLNGLQIALHEFSITMSATQACAKA